MGIKVLVLKAILANIVRYRKILGLLFMVFLVLFSLSFHKNQNKPQLSDNIFQLQNQHKPIQDRKKIKEDFQEEENQVNNDQNKHVPTIQKKLSTIDDIFLQNRIDDRQFLEKPIQGENRVNKQVPTVQTKLSTSDYDKSINSDDLEKIVHLDLKGAKPNVIYLEDFFKLIKSLGATGILIEYEDVFPYTGRLAEAVNGEHYTLEDIDFIKKKASENNLFIMPLVQTYGHLEWLLKLKSFAHLREHVDHPNVITPCLNESYSVIFDMIDQVVAQHNDSLYFHIGFDEVYFQLTNSNCRDIINRYNGDFKIAFMEHLKLVAAHVNRKLPNATVIIWDDMLRHMRLKFLKNYVTEMRNLKIEPMVWCYGEDVSEYVNNELFKIYGIIFKNVWAASAYKGSSGELATATSINHHYQNHVSWIEVITRERKINTVKFKGIALTGWSRYDHFLALCDLLPYSIPSLAYSMQVINNWGPLEDRHTNYISEILNCSTIFYTRYISSNLRANQCKFPGHKVYEEVVHIYVKTKEFQIFLDKVNKYMTPMNLGYNYVSSKRASESYPMLERNYIEMIKLQDNFVSAAKSIYTQETINEWLLVYLHPYLEAYYQLLKAIKKGYIETNYWRPRPLNVKTKTYKNDFL